MRMHLRYEFMVLGVEPILHNLRALNIGPLNKYVCVCICAYRMLMESFEVSLFTVRMHTHRHLDIFDLVRGDDEREMATRLGLVSCVVCSTYICTYIRTYIHTYTWQRYGSVRICHVCGRCCHSTSLKLLYPAIPTYSSLMPSPPLLLSVPAPAPPSAGPGGHQHHKCCRCPHSAHTV